MVMIQRSQLKEIIVGYANWVKQKINEGYEGHFITLMFNQLSGDTRQMNLQMQNQIENMYASFITRLYRRPHAAGVIHPILISCPDFPVPKHEKKPLAEVITNDGLHHHGILLVPPGSSRLKVPVRQHFTDNQSYYVRDQVLNRIDVRLITHDVYGVTDYALKGLKTNRLPGNETLLVLPKSNREISARPYRTDS